MRATDPLAHLACSSCRRPLSPPGTASSSASLNPASLFSLAPCGHILCGPCTNALVTATHSPDAAPLCPVCGVQGHLVPLDQAPSSVQHCFRPLPDLAHELGTAAGWQTAHLAEQLDFFKAKCAEQKSTLARCGVELKKLKALKQHVAQLETDNASLREQLVSLEHQQLPPQPLPHSQPFAALSQQQENRFAGPSAPQPQGLKRRRVASPEGPSLPTRPATHAPTPSYAHPRSHSSGTTSRGIPSNLPLAPARLSLTPAQQRKTQQARRLQGFEEEDRGQGQGMEGGSMRDQLARFAYDPSRSRSAAAAARPTSSTSRSTSRAHGPPPNAPFQDARAYGHGAAESHEPLQGDDETYGAAFELGQGQGRFFPSAAGGSAEADDAALMPPPPVPHQHHQQQQQRAGFVAASTMLSQQQQQERAPPREHTGTPRPGFGGHMTPARPHTAAPQRQQHAHAHAPGQPTTSTSAPSRSTHRQPFRPAPALAAAAPGGGGGGWSGGGGFGR